MLALASALAAAAHLIWVVPRLPRQVLDPNDPPPDYATLVRPRDGLLLAGIVAALAVALWRSPLAHYPMWLVYLGGGSALVWVDAKTMWLPKRLHWFVTAQLVFATAVTGIFAPLSALGALIGAGAMAGLLWLVWRFLGNFGFGDVRLGLIVGAMAGASGVQHWITALCAGTGIGALWAISHAIRRRTGPFPYGPSLWLGPLVAAAYHG